MKIVMFVISVAWALGEIGDARAAVDALIEALRDEDRYVRRKCCLRHLVR
jgi:HEAT repeat protein